MALFTILCIRDSNEIIETQRYRNSTETNLMTGSVSTLVDGQLYPGKTFPDTDTLRSGLYVSDRFDLSENTTVVLGIRHDRHELNPRVDALYENTAVSTTVAEINDGETSYKLGGLQDLGRYQCFCSICEELESRLNLRT